MPPRPRDAAPPPGRPAARRLFGLLASSKPIVPKKKDGSKSSDWVTAALGITLSLICALFPWYIFFNPEQFGPPQVRFEGVSGEPNMTVTLSPQTTRVGAPIEVDDIRIMDLDLISTGTLRQMKEAEEGQDPPDASQQPFPAPPVDFRLVHVAAGRAMMADDSGMFVVQRGSLLPDNSRVASIEQRNGKWVLVTTRDQTLTLGD